MVIAGQDRASYIVTPQDCDCILKVTSFPTVKETGEEGAPVTAATENPVPQVAGSTAVQPQSAAHEVLSLSLSLSHFFYVCVCTHRLHAGMYLDAHTYTHREFPFC
jgi:hypothetical protein